MKKLLSLLILTILVFPALVEAGDALPARLKGRILLQVEDNGEAWYVNPADSERYYLGLPEDAFRLMRELGLGISEADHQRWDGKAPAGLAGRIVLRVQSHGEAYYIDPLTLKFHYLGRPAEAFALMRVQGLGISNSDLAMIRIKNGYGIQERRDTAEGNGEEADEGAGKEENTPDSATSTDDTGDTGEEEDTATTTDGQASEPSSTSTPEKCLFKADYHVNAALSGFPYATRDESGISHDWASGAPEPLGYRNDLFSVRWTGNCYFEAGEYEFTAVFDDGIKAYFDGTSWIFNNWKNNGRQIEMKHVRTIEEGYHDIKVEYYEYKHDAKIKFYWEKKS